MVKYFDDKKYIFHERFYIVFSVISRVLDLALGHVW